MTRDNFFKIIDKQIGPEDRERIEWAYALAKQFHREQLRDEGVRYFEHCRNVALILVKYGPKLNATINDRPIVIPMVAIALLRCCSRVTSASNAIATAEIAPAPAIARPNITPQIDVDIAETAPPNAKINSPIAIKGLRAV